MRIETERCEICHGREAAVFMIVRQDLANPPAQGFGATRVAKAHACLRCFELARETTYVKVEAVSLQEWKETTESAV